MNYRPTKEEYYLSIAKGISSRSTCMSAKIGAILIKDDQIIATGYNGVPRKTQDCYTRGECLRRKLNIPSGERYELCRSVHAEMNCIINSARAGVSLLGSVLYIYGARIIENNEVAINALPCFICKKMIINAGITNVKCGTRDNKILTFSVEDWIIDWTGRDMLDDMHQYDGR